MVIALTIFPQYLNDQTSFRETLGKLTNANSLSVNPQGNLVPAGFFDGVFKGTFSHPRLVELKIMEFLIHGKKWLKPDDIKLIEGLASKAGLFMENQNSIKTHKELRLLLNLIAKEVLQKETTTPNDYANLCKAFQTRYRKLLAPFSKHCEQITKNFADMVQLQNENKNEAVEEFIGDETPSNSDSKDAEQQDQNEKKPLRLVNKVPLIEKNNRADALLEKNRLDAVSSFVIPGGQQTNNDVAVKKQVTLPNTLPAHKEDLSKPASTVLRTRKIANSFEENKKLIAKAALGSIVAVATVSTLYYAFKNGNTKDLTSLIDTTSPVDNPISYKVIATIGSVAIAIIGSACYSLTGNSREAPTGSSNDTSTSLASGLPKSSPRGSLTGNKVPTDENNDISLSSSPEEIKTEAKDGEQLNEETCYSSSSSNEESRRQQEVKQASTVLQPKYKDDRKGKSSTSSHSSSSGEEQGTQNDLKTREQYEDSLPGIIESKKTELFLNIDESLAQENTTVAQEQIDLMAQKFTENISLFDEQSKISPVKSQDNQFLVEKSPEKKNDNKIHSNVNQDSQICVQEWEHFQKELLDNNGETSSVSDIRITDIEDLIQEIELGELNQNISLQQFVDNNEDSYLTDFIADRDESDSQDFHEYGEFNQDDDEEYGFDTPEGAKLNHELQKSKQDLKVASSKLLEKLATKSKEKNGKDKDGIISINKAYISTPIKGGNEGNKEVVSLLKSLNTIRENYELRKISSFTEEEIKDFVEEIQQIVSASLAVLNTPIKISFKARREYIQATNILKELVLELKCHAKKNSVKDGEVNSICREGGQSIVLSNKVDLSVHSFQNTMAETIEAEVIQRSMSHINFFDYSRTDNAKVNRLRLLMEFNSLMLSLNPFNNLTEKNLEEEFNFSKQTMMNLINNAPLLGFEDAIKVLNGFLKEELYVLKELFLEKNNDVEIDVGKFRNKKLPDNIIFNSRADMENYRNKRTVFAKEYEGWLIVFTNYENFFEEIINTCINNLQNTSHNVSNGNNNSNVKRSLLSSFNLENEDLSGNDSESFDTESSGYYDESIIGDEDFETMISMIKDEKK